MEHRAPWLWRRLVSYINRHEQKSTFCDETPPLHFPLWRKLFHPILLNSLISVMMSWPNFGGESPLFNRPGAVRRVRQFSPSRRLRCKFERVILFELIHQFKLSSGSSKFSNFNFSSLIQGRNDVSTTSFVRHCKCPNKDYERTSFSDIKWKCQNLFLRRFFLAS